MCECECFTINPCYRRGHSRLGYYFLDKRLKDFVALDLGVYHDLLLFNQSILMR